MLRRDPHHFGFERARWTLEMVLERCEWLKLRTQAGLCRLFKRLNISYKRGRSYIHSPDPDYEAKLAAITQLRQRLSQARGQSALVYLDEVTLYRQPSVAHSYEQKGHTQPLAKRSPQWDNPTRIVATLDHHSGQVVYWRATTIGINQLVQFYQRLVATYAQQGVSRIYVVQDNWPVHLHPDVLVALEPQESLGRWPRRMKADWPTEPSAKAKTKWGELKLPIQFIQLPTYASWLNPIEKLWRKLKQELVHLHHLATDIASLRAGFDQFLDRFANGSLALLHYVGLFTD